ncbi:hypothetical protein ACSQ67_020962 [Phaseolus vulgaris]
MREFAAEIESLGTLRYKNMVTLQDWLKNKNDLLLIYDYISSGSLNSLLSKNVCFGLVPVIQIHKDVAAGLL